MSNARRTTLVTFLAAAALSLAWAGQPANKDPTPAPTPTKDEPGLPQFCLEVKKQSDAAAAKQKEADDRLASLVTSMNEATGPAKVDAMAAVVNELLAQRAAARERTTRLDAAMREHIMQHLAAAAPAQMGEKLRKDLEPCTMVNPAATPAR